MSTKMNQAKREIVTQELIVKVIKGILSTNDLGGGKLQPEKRKKFLDALQIQAEALGLFRRIDMKSFEYQIDKIAFPMLILQSAKDGNGNKVKFSTQLANVSNNPQFSQNSLKSNKFVGFCLFDEEVLDEVMTQDELEDYIIEKMAKSAALSLQHAFLFGNTDIPYDTDKLLSTSDGWIKKAVKIDTTDESLALDPNDYVKRVQLMQLAIPKAWRTKMVDTVCYVDFETEMKIRNQLSSRMGNWGDAMVRGDGTIVIGRTVVKVLPALDFEPNGKSVMFLTVPNNTVYGIYKDIEIRIDVNIIDSEVCVKVEVQGDAGYEEETAAVVIVE